MMEPRRLLLSKVDESPMSGVVIRARGRPIGV